MQDWIGQRISDEIQVLESIRLFSDFPKDAAWIDETISRIRHLGIESGVLESNYKNPIVYARILNRTEEYRKYYKIFSKFTHPSSWVINEKKEELEYSPFRIFFLVKTKGYLDELLGRVSSYINGRLSAKK